MKSRGVGANIIVGQYESKDVDVNMIEYHLEFYDEGGGQIEHYGNMENAFIPPRLGERVSLLGKNRTFEVTRVVYFFNEYQPLSIGYVTRVYGKELPFEPYA
jgi:hypothetical protein